MWDTSFSEKESKCCYGKAMHFDNLVVFANVVFDIGVNLIPQKKPKRLRSLLQRRGPRNLEFLKSTFSRILWI